jgi:hypothetical protein
MNTIKSKIIAIAMTLTIGANAQNNSSAPMTIPPAPIHLNNAPPTPAPPVINTEADKNARMEAQKHINMNLQSIDKVRDPARNAPPVMPNMINPAAPNMPVISHPEHHNPAMTPPTPPTLERREALNAPTAPADMHHPPVAPPMPEMPKAPVMRDIPAPVVPVIPAVPTPARPK